MISELDFQLEEFSEVNRIRCFLHVVNLVAKSLLKQFDVGNKHSESTGADDEEVEKLLAELAKDFENEESVTQSLDDTDEEMLDDVDNAVDGEDILTEDERAEIAAGIRPVTLVLAKVSAPRCPRSELKRQDLASKTRLQGHQFDDHSLACMEGGRRKIEDGCSNNASRCPDALEFDLRHA